MICFECPDCQKAFRVKPELAGKSAKCSGCGARINIPSPEDDELELALEDVPVAGNASSGQFQDNLLDEIRAVAPERTCPKCKTVLGASDVLCVACGYHLAKKQSVEGASPEDAPSRRVKQTVSESQSHQKGIVRKFLGPFGEVATENPIMVLMVVALTIFGLVWYFGTLEVRTTLAEKREEIHKISGVNVEMDVPRFSFSMPESVDIRGHVDCQLGVIISSEGQKPLAFGGPGKGIFDIAKGVAKLKVDFETILEDSRTRVNFTAILPSDIHRAVESEDVERVRTLLSSGAKVDQQAGYRIRGTKIVGGNRTAGKKTTSANNGRMFSPLYLAVQKENDQIVQLLLENDADPDFNVDGSSPRLLAGSKKLSKILKLFENH